MEALWCLKSDILFEPQEMEEILSFLTKERRRETLRQSGNERQQLLGSDHD